jgi:tetratricopeptide (TPR) repeat protein
MLNEGLALARAKPPQDGATGAILGAGFAYFRMSKPELGMPLIREAIERAGTNVWELIPIGSGLRDAGSQLQNVEMLSESVRVFEKARDAAPEMVSVRNELAVAYYFAGKTEDALREMKKAAEMAPTNPHMADQLSRMLEDAGQHNDASRWREIAKQRAAAAAPKP